MIVETSTQVMMCMRFFHITWLMALGTWWNEVVYNSIQQVGVVCRGVNETWFHNSHAKEGNKCTRERRKINNRVEVKVFTRKIIQFIFLSEKFFMAHYQESSKSFSFFDSPEEFHISVQCRESYIQQHELVEWESGVVDLSEMLLMLVLEESHPR